MPSVAKRELGHSSAKRLKNPIVYKGTIACRACVVSSSTGIREVGLSRACVTRKSERQVRSVVQIGHVWLASFLKTPPHLR